MRPTTTMLNPFSWSLDNWYTALQVMSAIILALTVAVGYVVSKRQATQIANAELETARVRERAEDLAKQNLDTESRLEAERLARLQLEQTLAPRALPYRFSKVGGSSVDALKPFAGTQVIIIVEPDREARRLAGHIKHSLEAADWKIVAVARPLDEAELPDGVTIEVRRPMDAPSPLSAPQRALVHLLESNKLETHSFQLANVGWPASVPDNVMLVKVGFKPDTYFSIKGSVEFWEKLLEAETDPQERNHIQQMIDQLKNVKP
jgi:hypothetical protein